MGIRKYNIFIEENDYMRCYTEDKQNSFIFDKDVYEELSKSYWRYEKKDNQFKSSRNDTVVSLSGFLKHVYNENKARRIDKSTHDYRKCNLSFGNKYIDCGDYYRVTTNQGKDFLIDKDDYELVSSYSSWYINDNGYVQGYYPGSCNHGHTLLHRLVMGVTVKEGDVYVDHIHHNTLDNRKSELRIVTNSQNNMNTGLRSNNTSGYTGIRKMSINGKTKWEAHVWQKGKYIHLGEFWNLEDAIKARIQGEEKYYGEYAYRVNNG